MFGSKFRYFFIALLGVYSYLNIKFTEGDSLVQMPLPEWVFFMLIVLVVLGVWELNRFVALKLHIRTFRSLYSPLINHFLLSLGVVLLISVIVASSLFLLYQVSVVSLSSKLILGFVFRINLFLQCVNAIIYYHSRLRESQLQAEQFKKLSAESQFDALRKQVNPHFLFNSFNVLSSLVYQDADIAAKFIDQLSTVYRYLLKNQDHKLVALREELSFLEAYIYLLEIRFKNNLKVENKLKKGVWDCYVAPSVLQLLIENAIKHNEVSKSQPLTINMYDQDGFIVVENNIQLKKQSEESSNVGLQNIRNRYSFLSEKDPVVVHSDEKFTVKIPLIKAEKT
ncbi:MAG: histidine kinase [Cyclobacteriaceae bacterium]|nr:histidine kinase [Cyclobacteriaceae bacterium HetDA_MAG_MS6]